MALLPAENEDYADFIVNYNSNLDGVVTYTSNEFFEIINEEFAVIYTPLASIGELAVDESNYGSIPKCFTYMDTEALQASGIAQVQNQPYLSLRGNGVAVAIIDSGIDYRHPAFLDAAGRTRIACLWDQSIPSGAQGGNIPYGTEFSEEQINEALASEDPYSVVPSRDETGHGTFLAGIAAGNAVPEQEFSGAAPEAAIIVVKLKPAKRYLRELFLLPEDAQLFQEDDIMFAVQYAVRCARRMRMPLSVCVGLGSNQGSHLGTGPIQTHLNWLSGYSQNVVSVAAGNEGNARHHFEGRIPLGSNDVTTELRVGENERGFVIEFWGNVPNFFSMDIQAPTGERIFIQTNQGGEPQTFRFIFIPTVIQATYVLLERQSGSTFIFLRFLEPAAGIWRFRIFSDTIYDAGFHMWLPVRGMISEDTYFVESSPSNTITSPGDAGEVITMTAYDYRDESLFLEAGRGYLADRTIKPELAAPGVNLKGPVPGRERAPEAVDVPEPRIPGTYASRSGTSIAAAQTAGAAALLMEWGVVRGLHPFLNGKSVKSYMIRGARRSRIREYPNPEWGFGMLDLYGVFELLS